jgi:hypothetical protein
MWAESVYTYNLTQADTPVRSDPVYVSVLTQEIPSFVAVIVSTADDGPARVKT